MSDITVEALLAQGAIERVREDRDAARADVAAAGTHIKSAMVIAESDPSGAFGLAYDAMRKSIAAHMRANGLRVKARTGAQYRTGQYGIAALGGLGIDGELAAFDIMRRTRNLSEYRGGPVSEADAMEAIGNAEAVLNVVAREIA